MLITLKMSKTKNSVWNEKHCNATSMSQLKNRSIKGLKKCRFSPIHTISAEYEENL